MWLAPLLQVYSELDADVPLILFLSDVFFFFTVYSSQSSEDSLLPVPRVVSADYQRNLAAQHKLPTVT